MSTTATTDTVEDVEGFRQRASAWIKENLPPATGGGMMGFRTGLSDEVELAEVAKERELQRTLFDGGFAGLCFPKEYGGQGLTPAHQQAFNREITGYQYPGRIQVPTMTPCAAVIMEFGTHEQKLAHIPAILKGEELWMQFLSEPSGGSDVAGALTTAERDGEEWVLNGSKIWTTGAWWSDWGLCLARTNWDVAKHRGLSVFMVKIHQPGIEVHRIEMLNGSREFCQEFITDVRLPDTDRIGEVDQGWTVGVRWMFHERMMHNSPYVTMPAGRDMMSMGPAMGRSLIESVPAHKRDDGNVRDLIGEGHTLDVVRGELMKRVVQGMMTGKLSDQAAALGRLFGGATGTRLSTIGFELAGSDAVAWTDETKSAGDRGIGFLMRQVGCIAGGTTEMARNVISERVLGMPRERTLDRDVAFRDVPRSAPTK